MILKFSGKTFTGLNRSKHGRGFYLGVKLNRQSEIDFREAQLNASPKVTLPMVFFGSKKPQPVVLVGGAAREKSVPVGSEVDVYVRAYLSSSPRNQPVQFCALERVVIKKRGRNILKPQSFLDESELFEE